MAPLNLYIYVCERSEHEKKSDYLKLKKKSTTKTISATKNRIKNFGLAILGGGGAPGAPPHLNPQVKYMLWVLKRTVLLSIKTSKHMLKLMGKKIFTVQYYMYAQNFVYLNL